MKISDFTVGADPEMFLIDTSTGKVISAKGIIPGKKGRPWRKGLPKGFGLEIDGILAEFNIPPCTSKGEYIESIQFMKNFIRDFVKNINPNYDIMCKSSTEVPAEVVADPSVNEIGCAPDFNAYTMEQTVCLDHWPGLVRCAGNHIHLGINKLRFSDRINIIKYFDLALGLKSLFSDADTERRKLYGKAGCYRPTKYGCEYRVLSSTMLLDENLPKVWDGIERTIQFFNDEVPLPDSDLIQKCINTSNLVLAEHLVKLYKDEVCVDLLA